MSVENDQTPGYEQGSRQRLVIQSIDEQSLLEAMHEESLEARHEPRSEAQPPLAASGAKVSSTPSVIEPVIIQLKYPLLTPLQARSYAGLSICAGALILAERIISTISRSQQVHESTPFSLTTIMFDVFPWFGSITVIIGGLGLLGLSLQAYYLLRFVHVCTSLILLLYLPFTIFYFALAFNFLFTNPLGALMIILMNVAWIAGFFILYRRDTRFLTR